MANKLVNYTGKFLISLLVILLVLSFAFWGVGDVMRGTANMAVAKVGNEEIPEADYRKLLNQEYEKLRQTFGGNVDPAAFESLGIGPRLLQQMIDETLVSGHARELGIYFSSDPIKVEIRNAPAFQTEQGQFDPDAFRRYLYTLNETEESFLEKVQEGLQGQALIESLTLALPVTDELTQAMYALEHEERTLRVLEIPSDYVASVGEPADAELTAYYAQNKEKFASPEIRSATVALLDDDAIKEETAVSEEELKTLYEERKKDFVVPEKRKVQLMVFGDEAKASVAIAALNEGKDFLSVAKEVAEQEKDETEYGEVSEFDLFPELGAAIFALKEGAYTASPVQSDLGWHVAKVTGITPATELDSDQVIPLLRDELQASRRDEVLHSLSTQLEDALAGGATLEEAAERSGARIEKFTRIVREEEQQKSAAVDPEMVNLIFSTPESQMSDVRRLTDDAGFYVLRVDSVAPRREKALDEVKGSVIQAWKAFKRREVLAMLATQARAEAISKGGKDVLAAAQKLLAADAPLVKAMDVKVKGTVEISKERTLTRGTVPASEDALPPALLQQVFTQKEGEITEPVATPDGDWVIAHISSVKKAMQPDEQVLPSYKERLRFAYMQDVWSQMTSYLRMQTPVEIFEDRLASPETAE